MLRGRPARLLVVGRRGIRRRVAAKLGLDAQRQPCLLAFLPRRVARVKRAERRDHEALGQRLATATTGPRRLWVEQLGQLASVEPGQRQVEAFVTQISQFERQQVNVPASVLGQLVVRKDVGAPLVLRQVRQVDRGHLARHWAAGDGLAGSP
ncbi:hypothetical protein D9M68_859310 [compost metagenome]